MSNGHSITALLSGVKRADREAIHALFGKCYSRVVAVSQKKFGGRPRRGFDQSDVANAAFHEFLDRVANGDFKKMENREDVWQVLTLIVGDKFKERLRHEGRKKRGGGEPDLPLEEVAQALSKLDDPSLEAEYNDALQFFMAILPSEDHRGVLMLLLEDRTHEEIAEKLKLSVRTVDRRIEDIRASQVRVLGNDAPKKKSTGQGLNQGEVRDEHGA